VTGEPTVEEQALALADEVLTLRARLRERDAVLDELRAHPVLVAADVYRQAWETEGRMGNDADWAREAAAARTKRTANALLRAARGES
jgi:hypothetical protein